MKQFSAYFKKHPNFNASVHFSIGMGLGILLTYPYFGTHPVRWGASLLVLGLLGHLYPLIVKTK